MKIAWTELASNDLSNIYEFIAQDDPRIAARIVTAVVAHVERQLLEYPNSGRAGRVAGTMELVVPRLPYIVPYRINGEQLEILRVYHAKRMWPDSFQ